MGNGIDFKKIALENRVMLDAALASEVALRKELERATSRYDRDVLGLNNEGDPVGGDPAGGYKNDNVRLQQRLTVAEQRAGEMESAAREMLRIAGIANQGSNAYNRAIINLHNALKPVETPYEYSGEDDFGHRERIAAALKPAEETKHICDGCGSNGWTGNCDKCIPY